MGKGKQLRKKTTMPASLAVASTAEEPSDTASAGQSNQAAVPDHTAPAGPSSSAAPTPSQRRPSSASPEPPTQRRGTFCAVLVGVPHHLPTQLLLGYVTKLWPSISRVTRIQSRRGPTPLVRLFFTEKAHYDAALAGGLDLLGSSLRIEPSRAVWTPPCRRCCLYGHSKEGCAAAPQCHYCGALNTTASCTQHDLSRRRRFCASCWGQDHFTGQACCPSRKQPTPVPPMPSTAASQRQVRLLPGSDTQGPPATQPPIAGPDTTSAILQKLEDIHAELLHVSTKLAALEEDLSETKSQLNCFSDRVFTLNTTKYDLGRSESNLERKMEEHHLSLRRLLKEEVAALLTMLEGRPSQDVKPTHHGHTTAPPSQQGSRGRRRQYFVPKIP